MLCVLSRLVSSSKTNVSCRDRIEIACGILSRPISLPKALASCRDRIRAQSCILSRPIFLPKALALCRDRILTQPCILSRPRNPSMHQIFGSIYAAYNNIRRLYRIKY